MWDDIGTDHNEKSKEMEEDARAQVEDVGKF
jgi:hypothetical protein